MATEGAQAVLETFITDNKVRVRFNNGMTYEKVVDFLYTLKPGQWDSLQKVSAFSSIKGEIADVAAQSQKVNAFLGINISESPWDAIKAGFSGIFSGNANGLLVLALFIGIAIPVLAWLTQWLNYKLMPQQGTSAEEGGMAGQMNAINNVMPIFSAFLCLTLNMGIGIYWIVGALIRCIQQVIINRRIGQVDLEELKQQAAERSPVKRAAPAAGAQGQKQGGKRRSDPHGGRVRGLPDAEQYYAKDDVPTNSLTAKANMVRNLDSKKNSQKKGKKSGKK